MVGNCLCFGKKNGNVETGLGHRTQAAGQSIKYITCKFYVVLFVKKKGQLVSKLLRMASGKFSTTTYRTH